ncbi:asialoglycoprotein receptor 1-like [Etheostoma cragini]|uniref:asialoglycoprotein receptor 1-like n=1 Tax=Etheostoma cragini TaxID=417921 RepID=UPI00155EAADC|nr:asialoglycoprotein receptor 1-like [Etheostoma cragini]
MDHPGPGPHPELRQRRTGKSASSLCPDGWTHHRRRCYVFGSAVASWASAERSCSLLFNSSLTGARSRRDVAWLWRFAGRNPFWIGQSGGSGPWMWTHRGSLSFSKMRGAPPKCVLVENPQRWISTSCSPETQHAVICSSAAPPP